MTALTRSDAPRFTDDELVEVNRAIQQNRPLLSRTVSDGLFTLYCSGRTIDEIVQIAPQYTAGQVLMARHHYGWDRMADDIMTRLSSLLPRRLQETRMRAINHLLDRIQVMDMEFRREMELYLQNPTEDNLPRERWRIGSDAKLAEVISNIQALLKLGQTDDSGDKSASQQGNSVTVVVNGQSKPAVVEVTPDNHLDALSALESSLQNVKK